MSGSPVPSASPGSGPSHPQELSGNVPRGLWRAQLGSRRSPEPLPPTEAAAGGWGQVDYVSPMGEFRPLAALPGSMMLMPGWNPILRSNPSRKDEIGNTRVAPKGATPVFLAFPIFLFP